MSSQERVFLYRIGNELVLRYFFALYPIQRKTTELFALSKVQLAAIVRVLFGEAKNLVERILSNFSQGPSLIAFMAWFDLLT